MSPYRDGNLIQRRMYVHINFICFSPERPFATNNSVMSMKCIRKSFFLLLVVVVVASSFYSAECQRIEGAKDGFQVRKDEDKKEDGESQLETISNRNKFLEWLFSWVSPTTEKEPTTTELPVVIDKCLPCGCGRANKKIRIIGGKPTQVNQYPWMALLMYNKKFYCGGSLINAKYILTAAHCVDGFTRQKITVHLLEHDRSIETESTVIERKVSRVIAHNGYNDRTFNNDIALLKLDREVPLKDDLRPVCLPPRGKSYSNEEGLVTGWGVLAQGGETSPILQELKVPILSNADCKKTKYGNRRITANMLCAGFPEGEKDACQGDSGGPLHVINNTIHDIVGVVSWGEGCARPGYPGVYTRVNRYITWIEQNTLDACPCFSKYSTVFASALADAPQTDFGLDPSPVDRYATNSADDLDASIP